MMTSVEENPSTACADTGKKASPKTRSKCTTTLNVCSRLNMREDDSKTFVFKTSANPLQCQSGFSTTEKVDCYHARMLCEKVLLNFLNALRDAAMSFSMPSYFNQLTEMSKEFHHQILNHNWHTIYHWLDFASSTTHDLKCYVHVQSQPTLLNHVDFLLSYADHIRRNIVNLVRLICDHHCPHFEPSVLVQAQSDADSDPGASVPNDVSYPDSDDEELPYAESVFSIPTNTIRSPSVIQIVGGSNGVFANRYLLELGQLLDSALAQGNFGTQQVIKFDLLDYRHIMRERQRLSSDIVINRLNTFSGIEDFISKISELTLLLTWFGQQRTDSYFSKFRKNYVSEHFDHHDIHCLFCKTAFVHCYAQGPQWCAAPTLCERHRLVLNFGYTVSTRDLFWYRYLIAQGTSNLQIRTFLGFSIEKYDEFLHSIRNTEELLAFHFSVTDSPVVTPLAEDDFSAQPFNAPLDVEEFTICNQRVIKLLDQDTHLETFLTLALLGNLKHARIFSTLNDEESVQYARTMFDIEVNFPYRVEPLLAYLFLDSIYRNYRKGYKISLFSELRKITSSIKNHTYSTTIDRFMREFSQLALS